MEPLLLTCIMPKVSKLLCNGSNLTIYNKLKADFGNPGNPKYVFKGLDAFVNTPASLMGIIMRNSVKERLDIMMLSSMYLIFPSSTRKVKLKTVNQPELNASMKSWENPTLSI